MSDAVRPTPFDVALGHLPAERFPPLREALAQGGRDARDRDAFLMTREAVQLIRDLRPDEGVGEMIDQLAAFVHHAFVFWDAGERVVPLASPAMDQLLAAASTGAPAAGGPFYAPVPERRLWAEVVEGAPIEPLDGCAIHDHPDGGIRVLGIFGMRPDRGGFSVVEAAGLRAPALAREDGSPLFASRLAGGMAADLHSIAGEEELLELGWRLRDHAAGVPA